MSSSRNDRFLALDSCRGLCACLVAWFHFNKDSGSFIAHSYLFVDFFFVLSGFVIAHSYLSRLAEPRQLGSFMVLRFGRLYPLHLFILGCYVALESVKLLPALHGIGAGHPFSSADRNVPALITNVLMIHGLGMHDALTWNRPSWSISTEFWCYLLFGVAATYGWIRKSVLVSVAVAGAALVYFFSPRAMDATFDLGFARCVCGFSIGVLCYFVYKAAPKRPSSFGVATAYEALVLTVAVTFVSFAKDGSAWTILAPVVFAPAVWLLSFESGGLSALLRHRSVQRIGVLSYSIYMTHGLVKDLADSAAVIFEKTTSVTVSRMVDVSGAGIVRVFGLTPFSSLWWSIGLLAVTIVVSWFTYSWIEAPFRERSRQFAKRLRRAASPPGYAGPASISV
jgi:peptidoglycan/LPS O-acetylase OafA/YrhL